MFCCCNSALHFQICLILLLKRLNKCSKIQWPALKYLDVELVVSIFFLISRSIRYYIILPIAVSKVARYFVCAGPKITVPGKFICGCSSSVTDIICILLEFALPIWMFCLYNLIYIYLTISMKNSIAVYKNKQHSWGLGLIQGELNH